MYGQAAQAITTKIITLTATVAQTISGLRRPGLFLCAFTGFFAGTGTDALGEKTGFTARGIGAVFSTSAASCGFTGEGLSSPWEAAPRNFWAVHAIPWRARWLPGLISSAFFNSSTAAF